MAALLPRFPHRQNPDRSWDSICRECYVTIANALTEEELAGHEEVHKCNVAINREFVRVN